MKIKYLLFVLVAFIGLSAFQCDDDFVEIVNFEYQCDLIEELREVSGIIPFGDNMLAFGDSGSKNSLFEIDSDCNLINEFNIPDAVNVDWEAIAISDGFIYIGNFGNNFGNRYNLEILKIDVNELSSETPIFSRLNFTYEDQEDFEQRDEHNFDCEAMFIDGVNIYLVTKNRANDVSHVYNINTIETEQIAKRKLDVELNRLVTDAYYVENDGNVLMSAYNIVDDVFFSSIHLINYENNQYSTRPLSFTGLPDMQIESICVLNDQIFIASEAEDSGMPQLFQVNYQQYISQ